MVLGYRLLSNVVLMIVYLLLLDCWTLIALHTCTLYTRHNILRVL
jgi:hypothetical protein